MNVLTQTVQRLGSFLVSANGDAERRVAPRMPRRLRLQIAGLELYSTNINAVGLQLACPVLWLPHLRAGWNPRALEVDLELPAQGWVRALCEVVYLYDYDDEVLVGLRFKAFAPEAAAHWQAYVAQVSDTAQRAAVRL